MIYVYLTIALTVLLIFLKVQEIRKLIATKDSQQSNIHKSTFSFTLPEFGHGMLIHQIKFAFRLILKRKIQYALSISSITMGLLTSTITLLIVRSEYIGNGYLDPFSLALLVVGVFVLGMAILNFINQITSSFSPRNREIGVRKTIGANSGELLWQFFIENILVIAIGIISSIVLGFIITPWLSGLVGVSFELLNQKNISLFAILATTILLVSVMASFIPAQILAKIKPIAALKGLSPLNRILNIYKKTGLIIQVAASFTLLSSTVIIWKQIGKTSLLKSTASNVRVLFREVKEPNYLMIRYRDVFSQSFYKSPDITIEENLGLIVTFFAIIIFISGILGIIALASFSISRRTIEIGIRKVLGISHRGVVLELSKPFFGVISAGIILGVPLTYFLIKRWLSLFKDEILLSYKYFVYPGIFVLFIFLVIVAIQGWRASFQNPIETLRNE